MGCSKQGCSDRQTGICGAFEECSSGGDIALRQMPLACCQKPFLAGLRGVRELWRWLTVASGPVNQGLVFRAQGCGRLLVGREAAGPTISADTASARMVFSKSFAIGPGVWAVALLDLAKLNLNVPVDVSGRSTCSSPLSMSVHFSNPGP